MKLICSFLLLAFVSCNTRKGVDAIIYSAKLYANTDSNAEALAIANGKILAIGTNADIAQKYQSDSIINARSAYIYPGFIDAHCHFSSYGLTLYQCDLVGTKSFEEILQKLVEYDKNNSLSWVYGRGWDQNDWEQKNFPDNSELNRLFPEKPVVLKRVDGHAVLCNQKALEIAKVDINTTVTGGIIERKDGKLTGILIDNAADLVDEIIGDLPEKKMIKYLKVLEEKCYKHGLTGLVECGVKSENIHLLKKFYSQDMLSIALAVQLSSDSQTLAQFVTKGPFREKSLVVNGIKIYADGALGSRGACLLDPYNDMPGHYGLILTGQEKIKEIALNGYKYGWQVCTHAIGDSANRIVLKTYADILKTKNDRRWRIEHAQVVNYNDYMYFSDYSIIPSVQPTHAISDMPWAVTRLGEKRLAEAYAYKNLMKLNGWIPLGTDFPVEDINPIATFYTAVARKDKNGNPVNGYMKENALTREEALKGITIWAARGSFIEKEKGSIEVGKDADIVILDKDIMTIAENEIMAAKVLYTISKGKIKYQK